MRTAIENVERTTEGLNNFKSGEEYILTFLELSDYGPKELKTFEDGLTSLGNATEPQVYVGLLGDLLNGNTSIINRDPELARKARNMESVVENILNNTRWNRTRIAQFEGNLNPFVGPGSISRGTPPLYHLEQLKSSSKFRNIVRAIIRCTRNMESFSENLANRLEEFSAALEEY